MKIVAFFRLSGFLDLSDDDQMKVKEKLNSWTTINRKRKGEKEISSETPQIKQAKLDESTLEETRLRKVIWFFLVRKRISVWCLRSKANFCGNTKMIYVKRNFQMMS